MIAKTSIAVIILLFAIFGLAGIGYAYTASTENTNNTTESQYILLSQSNYTFSAGASFSYYSLTGSDGITIYYITGARNDAGQSLPVVHCLDREDGTYTTHPQNDYEYYGVQIGHSTTLHIDTSHYRIQDPAPTMTLAVDMDYTNNLKFTKFQPGIDFWTYLLKIYYLDGGQKDIHWLWSKGNGWNNAIGNGITKGGGKWVNVLIDPTKDYIVELYFAGPGKTIPGYSDKLPASEVEPVGNLSYWENGEEVFRDSRLLIYEGVVSFRYDSNSDPIIKYDANGGNGKMSIQEVKSNIETALRTNQFTKSGSIFIGWNTRADGTGQSYTASVSTDKNLILYAQWGPRN